MGKYLSAKACMLLISGLIILLSVNTALNKTSSADASQKAREKALDTAKRKALKAEVAKKGEKVLVEVSGSNWAYGFHYKGTVILTEGSIYEFDASYIDNPRDEINSGRSLILDNLTRKIGDVSNKDLKMIKKYAAEVKEKLTPLKNIAADAGSYYTKVYDYTASRKVLLQLTGSNVRLNTDKSTGNLRLIIDKYIPGSCFHDFVKPKKDEKVLVENMFVSRSNRGEEIIHSGTAILTDGSIYYFYKSDGWFFFGPPIILDDDGILDFEDSYSYRNKLQNDKKDPGSSLILANLTKKIGIVSKEELKMIKKYAAEVKEMLPQTIASDADRDYTKVYDYTGNREVLLKRTGDRVQINDHEIAEKLNQIIKKYPHTPLNPR